MLIFQYHYHDDHHHQKFVHVVFVMDVKYLVHELYHVHVAELNVQQVHYHHGDLIVVVFVQVVDDEEREGNQNR